MLGAVVRWLEKIGPPSYLRYLFGSKVHSLEVNISLAQQVMFRLRSSDGDVNSGMALLLKKLCISGLMNAVCNQWRHQILVE